MKCVVIAVVMVCAIYTPAFSQLKYKPGRFYFPLQISAGKDPFQFSYASLVQTSAHAGVGYALNGMLRLQVGAIVNRFVPNLSRPSSQGVPPQYYPNKYSLPATYVGSEVSITYLHRSPNSIHLYSTLGTSWQKSIGEREFSGVYLSEDRYLSSQGRFRSQTWTSFAELGIHLDKKTIISNVGIRYSYVPLVFAGSYRDATGINNQYRQSIPSHSYAFNQGYVSLTVAKTFGRGFDYGVARSLRH
ncbi:MAG: hypothetical protein WDO14_23385 [Bacteroidota bacterium]